MDLVRKTTPFDHDDWIFEVKHDGFRAVAYIKGDECKLVSGNDNDFTRFHELARVLPDDIDAKNAILDGEIVVLDNLGHSKFSDLMTGRGTVAFAAFDLLWLNGKDLRDVLLIERKELLRSRIRH